MSNITNPNIENLKGLGLSDLTRTEREAIAQKGIERAIKRMHSSGVATLEVHFDGSRYLHYPDGKRTPLLQKDSIDKGIKE